MKHKFSVILLALIACLGLMFGVVGCGEAASDPSTDGETDVEEGAEQTPEESEDTEKGIEGVYKFVSMTMTASYESTQILSVSYKVGDTLDMVDPENDERTVKCVLTEDFLVFTLKKDGTGTCTSAVTFDGEMKQQEVEATYTMDPNDANRFTITMKKMSDSVTEKTEVQMSGKIEGDTMTLHESETENGYVSDYVYVLRKVSADESEVA